MLEQKAEQFVGKQEEVDEKQLFQKNVNDFIEAVPEKGSLYKKEEKREITTRAIAFGQLYNQLSLIAEGSRSLSQEQKSQIMKRTDALIQEAHFWTGQTNTGRNFVEEIKEMGQLIWRR